MPLPHRARVLLGAAGASLALVALSACSSGPSDSGPQSTGTDAPASTSSAPATSADSTPAESSSATESSSTPTADSSNNDGLLAAGERAEKAVSGSTLISIETERNDTQWEVEVVTADGTEHEVYVSSDGSKIVRGPIEQKDDAADKAKHRDRVKAAKLDYKEAVKAVTKVVAGRVTELNIDTENGTTVWEADVIDSSGTKHEITIDAASGKLIKQD